MLVFNNTYFFFCYNKIDLEKIFQNRWEIKMSATGLSVSGERTSGDSVRTQNGIVDCWFSIRLVANNIKQLIFSDGGRLVGQYCQELIGSLGFGQNACRWHWCMSIWSNNPNEIPIMLNFLFIKRMWQSQMTVPPF